MRAVKTADETSTTYLTIKNLSLEQFISFKEWLDLDKENVRQYFPIGRFDSINDPLTFAEEYKQMGCSKGLSILKFSRACAIIKKVLTRFLNGNKLTVRNTSSPLFGGRRKTKRKGRKTRCRNI